MVPCIVCGNPLEGAGSCRHKGTPHEERKDRMKTWDEFLTKIIDDGIAAARKDYADSPEKLKGSVAGFEACRGRDPAGLMELRSQAAEATARAFRERVNNYWEIRCYEAEVEWTCNVVSAALVNQGQEPIYPPTARGLMKAAEILGVSDGTSA